MKAGGPPGTHAPPNLGLKFLLGGAPSLSPSSAAEGPAPGRRGLQCYAGRVQIVVQGRRTTSHAPGGRRAWPRARPPQPPPPPPDASRWLPSALGRSGSSEATLFWGPRCPSTSPGRVAGPRQGRDRFHPPGPLAAGCEVGGGPGGRRGRGAAAPESSGEAAA